MLEKTRATRRYSCIAVKSMGSESTRSARRSLGAAAAKVGARRKIPRTDIMRLGG